jgi:plastocyanin
MRRLALTLAIAALAAGLAACGTAATPSPSATTAASVPAATTGGGASAPASAPASAATTGACATAPAGSTAAATVTIKNFAFSPSPVQVKVGEVVAWTNGDSALHSATMDSGACDTDTISSGSTAMLVFTAPGTYTYHCKVHPTQMKDVTVEVK